MAMGVTLVVCSSHVVLCGALAAGLWAAPRALLGATLVERPLPALRLALLACAPLLLAVFSGPWHRAPGRTRSAAVRDGVVGMAAGTAAFFLLAVAFGASVTRMAWETLHLAALMSMLVALPPAAAVGLSPATWVRLFASTKPATAAEVVCSIPGHFAVAGAWVGAWPIPLDWDRPWQAWPVTCACGGGVGYVLGTAAALAWAARAGAGRVKRKGGGRVKGE